MRTKLGNPFLSYSAVAYLFSWLPLAWGHSFREWTHSAPLWPVLAFVACFVYSLSIRVFCFVLCLDRCLFYDSATWAQAAVPTATVPYSNISSYLSGFGP